MNKNNVIVVDVDKSKLNIEYARYFLQAHEQKIKSLFHGTGQQFINAGDLNRIMPKEFRFRNPKINEDLKGKLCMNRVGSFGVEFYK